MPCGKQRFLLLQQSVSVGSVSKDVDALVVRIGESLQLHGGPGGPSTVSLSVSLSGGPGGPGPRDGFGLSGPAGPPPVQNRTPTCCMRLRNRARCPGTQQVRISPYSRPGSEGDRVRKHQNQKDQEDPHRLLQDLILSGNLIKEAVRRLQDLQRPARTGLDLQRPAGTGPDLQRPADTVPC